MLKIDNKFFQYSMIGEFHSNGKWIHPQRIIDSYEMIFVLDGEVCLHEDDIEYKLNPNDIIILEPGKRHGGTKISSEPISFYWFHFYTDIEIPCKICIGKEEYDLKYLLKKLLHVTNSYTYPENSADALGLHALYEYIHIACNDIRQNSALLKKIKEYVRINSCSNISITDIANHFGYNADYIGRQFKKSFNIGIKEYIIGEKLKLSKNLLLTTNLSIKEIAAQLNFREENLFIKFFIYHEKISPTKFRNKYSETHMNNI